MKVALIAVLLLGAASAGADDLTHPESSAYVHAFLAGAAKSMAEDADQIVEFINYNGCTTGGRKLFSS